MTLQTRLSGTDYPLKINATEFLALADAGLFEHYCHTELIEGEVWTMNAVHRWHARVQAQFTVALHMAVATSGFNLVIYNAGSVLMSDNSVPEPDISIAYEEPLTREPISLAAVKIAVELSDTTRDFDLGRKAKLYARCGVPEYWVADRDKQVLVRHSGAQPAGYASIVPVPFGQPMTSATLAGLIVETHCLLD